MKNIYLLGISIAVSIAVLYLVWQQKKRLEQLENITRSIQPITLNNLVDREFFIQETQGVHKKIESSYDRIHQQYLEVLASIDNLPVLGSMEYSGEEQSENIRSYHGENLIDIDEHKHSLDLNLEEPIPQSVLGIAEPSQPGSISMGSKISSSKKSSSINNKNNTEPIVENNSSIENGAVSYSMSSKIPKLPELRDLCKKYGLSSYGNKKELLERLNKVNVFF